MPPYAACAARVCVQQNNLTHMGMIIVMCTECISKEQAKGFDKTEKIQNVEF